MKKRLSKVLAAAGVASRRKCEDLIFAGAVFVNGEKILLPQTLVCPKQDRITVQGEPLQTEETKVAFVLNKPPMTLCTNKRPNKKARIVTDLFEDQPYRLFSVGRLDKQTTGLLIVTNDGELAQSIIHPSANIKKEYVAKVDKEISDTHLKLVQGGLEIDGVFVKPHKVQKVRKGTIKIVISEGKNREVRRLLGKAGLDVISLTRTAIGNLRLGLLPEGAFRSLTEKDKKALFA